MYREKKKRIFPAIFLETYDFKEEEIKVKNETETLIKFSLQKYTAAVHLLRVTSVEAARCPQPGTLCLISLYLFLPYNPSRRDFFIIINKN